MRFTSVHINGFRGIKTLDLKSLGNINLFLGQNNSGKTSVLEAIFLLSGVSNPKLALNIDGFRDLGHNEGDDFRFIYYSLDYGSSLKIQGNLEDPEQERSVNIDPLLQVRGSDSVENNIKTIDIDTGDFKEAIGLRYRFSIKERHKQKSDFEAQLIYDSDTRNFRTIEAKKYKEKLFGVYLSSKVSLRTIHSRLEKLIVEKRKKEVVDALRLIDDSIIDIVPLGNYMIYFDVGINRLMPANIMGDGIIKMLNVVTTIYDARNGVVFIDEVDNGLHFKALNSLWETILKFSNQYNTQIFLTTHSKECIEHLTKILDKEEFKTFKDKVKLHTISRNKKGNVNSYQYDYDEFTHAVNSGNELRGEF